MITVYYGMSGTLKGTTIESQKKKDPDLCIMETGIKRWKSYQFGPFKDRIDYNDLQYGILHLVRLGDFLATNQGNLVIERSVSDSLFYYYHGTEFSSGSGQEESQSFIGDVLKEEDKLYEGHEVKRILLIQKDVNFIRDYVMKDWTRRRTFGDGNVDLYLEQQDLYVDFTKRYNKIDEVVVIENARDYIEGVLGEKMI